MRSLELSFIWWPVRRWLAWRVENTVCTWTLRAGPFSVIVEK